MSIHDLPIALTDMICQFAYNTPCKKDIFDDLTYQETAQKNIPMLFFTQSLPCEPLFRGPSCRTISPRDCRLVDPRPESDNWYRSTDIFRHAYVDLYTPNPFRLGNPYYPTWAIHPRCQFFSMIPLQMCHLLRSTAVRAAKKYQGSLCKRVRSFVKQGALGLHNWNYFLETVMQHEFWYSVECYHAFTSLEEGLIRKWVSELPHASFAEFL